VNEFHDFMVDEVGFDTDFEWFGKVGYYRSGDAVFRLYPKIQDGVIREFVLDVSTIKTQPIHHIELKLIELLRTEDDEDFRDIAIVQRDGEYTWSVDDEVDVDFFVEEVDSFVRVMED